MVKVSGAMHDNVGSTREQPICAKLLKVGSISSLDPPRTLLRRDLHWVITFSLFFLVEMFN